MDNCQTYFLFLALVNTANYHRPIKTLTPEEYQIQYESYASKTTTSFRSEIVPKWASVERYQPYNPRLINQPIDIQAGNAQILDFNEYPGDMQFRANAESEGASAIYYRNYYPSWHATVDGVRVVLTSTETGEIRIPLTKGLHFYRIYMGSTQAQKLGNYTSFFAFMGLILLAIKGANTRRREKRRLNNLGSLGT